MEKDFSKINLRVFGAVALVFFIAAAVSIFSSDGKIEFTDAVRNAYDTYRYDGSVLGSGVIGAAFGFLMLTITGWSKAAAGAIVIILIFALALLISGLTLARFFKGLWKPVEKTKNFANEKYVEYSERREERADRANRIDTIDPATDLTPDKKVKDIPTLEETENSSPDSAAQPAVTETVSPSAVIDDIIKKTNAAEEKKAKAEEAKKSEKEFAEEVEKNSNEKKKDYVFPPISCLKKGSGSDGILNEAELKANAEKLVETLRSFGVETKIVGLSRGPSVTRYEIQPAAGVKISKITNLADDIALNLAASGVRIEAPIPNKPAVGIEVPNRTRAGVSLREIIDTDDFRNADSKLNIALGKDITGGIVYADLQKMPHLLVAGTTGSGKSICLNTMIISILYNATPDEVKLILIDPKQVEFIKYNGIPHLLVPVVSNPNKAAGALAWAVTEMLKRYAKFAEKGVRDIAGYNSVCEPLGEEKMPQVVIFIDEFSDLMMAAPTEVEDSVCRLAQMARAAGMHLVIATQRPSVDVITGVIKSNIPSRIALTVKSNVESRIMLDEGGAEKLLGKGDLLYNPISAIKPVRVQGAFVSDKEVEDVVNFIKKQGESSYDDEVNQEMERLAASKDKKKTVDTDSDDSEADEMLPKAIEVVVEAQMASTTLLQRKLKLGYARAARIVDELEARNIVGPYEGSKPRKVLISKQQWMEMNALSNDDNGYQGSYEAAEEAENEVISESEATGNNIF
ncbi:MAG: DNA translocase FtsK [Clostridia bacterium]|nr:DNA translocase FtsK [Clostridia bacterium]